MPQIEQRTVAGDASLLELLFRHRTARNGFIELIAGDDVLRGERLQSIALRGQQLQIGFQALHRGFVVAQDQLQPLVVESCNDFAFVHGAPGLGDPFERAAHLRCQSGVVAARDGSCRRHTRRERLLLGFNDHHRRRRCVSCFRRLQTWQERE